jgi:ABC-2 type transport system permease protein
MSTPEPILEPNALDTAQEPPAAVFQARPPVLRTLIRRELWEHRALWIAPLAVAGLLLLLAIIGMRNFDSSGVALPEQRRALFAVIMAYAVVPQFLVLGVVSWMYAGDCLYTERKDRSILFWKSMPVSDTLTVLSKLLLVVVLVPLGVYVVSLVTTLLMSGIYLVRAWQDHAGGFFWDGGTWLRIQWITLVSVVAGSLWYAPITAFLMLVSAWARRSVQLWVFLPPIILAVGESFALGSHHIRDILFYRLGGVFTHSMVALPAARTDAEATGALNLLFANIDPSPVFANVDLWLGLVVAAALIVATIRIRQYRDDT